MSITKKVSYKLFPFLFYFLYF